MESSDSNVVLLSYREWFQNDQDPDKGSLPTPNFSHGMVSMLHCLLTLSLQT